MRLVITGDRGMLGRCLHQFLSQHQVHGMDLPEHDLTNASAVDAAIAAIKPQVVVHCAAFTKVDDCETQIEAAYAVNALASANLAIACQRHGARLIAISTDYVFAGDAGAPYREWDTPAPQSIYGKSKLAGEQAIQHHLPDHTIVRIAWLYGAGGPSFFHTMAKLGADADAAPLKVVDDQWGNPTSTTAVADLVAHLVEEPLPGIVHGTCEGDTTWFGFTQEIFAQLGLKRAVEPCTTAEFPRPAPRPANSRLDNCVLRLSGRRQQPSWQDALRQFIKEHPHG